MSTPWLGALVATLSFISWVYFVADVAVLSQGPTRVPPYVLRLAQAGDRNIAKGSAASIVITVVVALFFQWVVAAVLVGEWNDLGVIARLLLTLELLAAAATAIAMARWIGRYPARPSGRQ